MSEYDAVLFDSDGILVEPPPAETQSTATRAAFHEVGIDEPARTHVQAIVDGVTVGELEEICTAYDLEPETFWEARERHDERSQLEEFERGVRGRYDDVSAIVDLPVDCGVVSNNHHSTIEFVLAYFDLERAFETYYGREMTIESLELKKPNAHYLERAIADLSAESVLYVGDSESDVVAATRAGLESAFVRRPHCRGTELEATPTYDLEDLHDVADLVRGDGRRRA
ncbi:HAD family hydrolase [Natrarchaeobius oligotrophus]|uniref:HAD family hydrolase n=1 Tax=Natrarchaeobius chitinivorans TaxID=1679083 RepID=A0A3N6NN37_NATCH|nr:HAD-IA family hydrolase [Natrarchaeobius chitinivorans]RQH00913.1 HAD family hydrolase [Natrarchaeobius chitinivorans]